MPGWIDTHVHLNWHFGPDGKLASGRGETAQQSALYAAGNAYATLMAGFTTVQSPGAPIERELRDAIAQNAVPGPRVLTSMGSINQTDGDPAKIRARVQQMIADGADVLSGRKNSRLSGQTDRIIAPRRALRTQDAARESGVHYRCCDHAGLGNRGQYCDFQCGQRRSVASPPLHRPRPAGRAARDQAASIPGVFRLAGQLSRLAETEHGLRADRGCQKLLLQPCG